MSKKIKAVDIANEEPVEEKPIEEKPLEIEPKIEPAIEQPKEEEPVKVETPTDDDVKITEIIKEEAEKPKTKERKTVTCPKCNKVLLEKNYKYSHQAVCGKVKVKAVEAIEEKPKPKVEASPSLKVELKEKPPEEIPLPKPTYWEIRKQYNNHLKEQKQQLVKRLVSKAF